MRLKYYLAAAAAVAALMPQAQEGGPPGSEAPAEMGGEVETIIVIGTMYRCPDGTMVGDVTACPAYVSFSNSFLFGFYDPVQHIIRQGFTASTQTCGATVDANCDCGAGKVKVYDKSNDEFHCYNEPPPGCANWDDMFDFDLNVWACTARPLDASAQAAVDRLKGCFGSGSTVQNHLGDVLRFEYGSCPAPSPGCIKSCTAGSSVVTFDRNNITNLAGPDTTVWQWFAETMNHELRHVYHNATYGCGPWNNPNFWTGEQVPSFVPRNSIGEEQWTGFKAVVEYESELGVKSPYDSQYDPSKHKQLKNCRLW